MQRDQIIEKIGNLLKQHASGARGSVHQEPYKGDFFALFISSYESALLNSNPSRPRQLTADVLAEILSERFPEVVELDAWHDVYTFWLEWTYAVKKYSSGCRHPSTAPEPML